MTTALGAGIIFGLYCMAGTLIDHLTRARLSRWAWAASEKVQARIERLAEQAGGWVYGYLRDL
jgi:hypothetical protein